MSRQHATRAGSGASRPDWTRSLAAITAVTVMVFMVGACSTGTEEASGEPKFSGPYKAEFEENYRTTSSDFAREVLQDGKIMEAEASEANSRLTTCLSGLGLTNIMIHDQGELQYDFPAGSTDQQQESLMQRADECQVSTGWTHIVPLYGKIRANPEAKDQSDEIAKCLVRNGFKPEGYSGEDFKKDNGVVNMSPSDPKYQRYYACLTDPLHAE